MCFQLVSGTFRHIIHIHLYRGGRRNFIRHHVRRGWRGQSRKNRHKVCHRYLTCDRGATLRWSAVRFGVALFVLSRKFERTQGWEIRDVYNFPSGGGRLLSNLIRCANVGRRNAQIMSHDTIPTGNEQECGGTCARHRHSSRFIPLSPRWRHPISDFAALSGIASFSPGRHSIFWHRSIDLAHTVTKDRVRAAISMYCRRDMAKTSSIADREEVNL